MPDIIKVGAVLLSYDMVGALLCLTAGLKVAQGPRVCDFIFYLIKHYLSKMSENGTRLHHIIKNRNGWFLMSILIPQKL